jgi:hypothetical protein
MFTAAAGASTIWTAEATPVAIVMASNNIMKHFFKGPSSDSIYRLKQLQTVRAAESC